MVLIWTLPKKFQSQDLWNWGYASLDSSEKWTKQQQKKKSGLQTEKTLKREEMADEVGGI